MTTNIDNDYILQALRKTDSYLFDRHQWGQRMFKFGVRCCLVGAARHVNQNGLNDPCINFMCDRLRDYEGYAGIDHTAEPAWSLVAVFNDLPETAFKHIKAFLKYCIDYREWMLTTGSAQ